MFSVDCEEHFVQRVVTRLAGLKVGNLMVVRMYYQDVLSTSSSTACASINSSGSESSAWMKSRASLYACRRVRAWAKMSTSIVNNASNCFGKTLAMTSNENLRILIRHPIQGLAALLEPDPLQIGEELLAQLMSTADWPSWTAGATGQKPAELVLAVEFVRAGHGHLGGNFMASSTKAVRATANTAMSTRSRLTSLPFGLNDLQRESAAGKGCAVDPDSGYRGQESLKHPIDGDGRCDPDRARLPLGARHATPRNCGRGSAHDII